PFAMSPNSQQSSPRRPLSAHSIKVELYSDDESPGSRDSLRDDGRKEVGGERVDAGRGRLKAAVGSEVSSPKTASPGPIRLSNGKLQCELCGMVCTGPNVLMVHKRSHTGSVEGEGLDGASRTEAWFSPTGERPFKCNQCGASFTQKGNLLRHIKLHSGEKPFKCNICNYACRRRDALAGHLRTHTVAPQTVGKPFKCAYCSRSYKQQNTLEDHLERCHSYLKSLGRQAAVVTQTAPGTEIMDGMRKSNEKSLLVDRLAMSITKRKRSTPQKSLGEKHMHLELPEAPCDLSSSSEKDEELTSSRPAAAIPAASLHVDGSKKENQQPSPLSPLHPSFPAAQRFGQQQRLPHSRSTASPGQAKDPDWERAGLVPPTLIKKTPGSLLSPTESVQVLDSHGHPVRSFRCLHCHILFLDYVMFTIHMGCHGFRRPFECNICGHSSRDRYEFSSHISRGEHQVG
ncbi:unnamed protein product, partial [Tetraodon nigroviridis]